MRFPSDVEAALFRVVQGTIGNIVEYSKAKNASIVLVYQPDEVSLSISDDRQGFDVSKILVHTALPPSHCQALIRSLQIFKENFRTGRPKRVVSAAWSVALRSKTDMHILKSSFLIAINYSLSVCLSPIVGHKLTIVGNKLHGHPGHYDIHISFRHRKEESCNSE